MEWEELERFGSIPATIERAVTVRPLARLIGLILDFPFLDVLDSTLRRDLACVRVNSLDVLELPRSADELAPSLERRLPRPAVLGDRPMGSFKLVEALVAILVKIDRVAPMRSGSRDLIILLVDVVFDSVEIRALKHVQGEDPAQKASEGAVEAPSDFLERPIHLGLELPQQL